MTELLTSAQMRVIETAAMDSGTVTGLELMERAGRGAVAAMLEEWPEWADTAGRAVVLCGPGNNGGDGYVIARHLFQRGWDIEVLGMGNPSGDAGEMRIQWEALGPVAELGAAGQGRRPDLLVDALFGTGLTRALPEDAVEAFTAVRKRPARGRSPRIRVLAVDCPSGLSCDSGRLLLPDEGEVPEDQWAEDLFRRCFQADLCVTFHAPKLGHYLDAGPNLSRALRVVDIGLPAQPEPAPFEMPRPGVARLVDRQRAGREMPARMWPGALIGPIGTGGHKYDRGHVLVLSGGVGRGGAARLAARAALRIGAGLVTIGCPPAALRENAARLDAIMLRAIGDADELTEVLQDHRLSALVLGPGLGVGARTRSLVASALAAKRPVVLDADALTSHEDAADALFDQLHDQAVLTPHEGEFARLFPDLGRRTRRISKAEAAAEAADRAGCTILLKGPDTVVASPGGHLSVHTAAYGREAPWLGTAGAGDVLAGLVAGLMAPQRHAPHPCTETAAWLHVEAARRFGPGLIAEDLPEQLPGVFRDLGL